MTFAIHYDRETMEIISTSCTKKRANMSIENTIEDLDSTRDDLVSIAKQLVGKTYEEVYSTKLYTLLYEFLAKECIIQFDFGEDGTNAIPRVAIRGEILV